MTLYIYKVLHYPEQVTWKDGLFSPNFTISNYFKNIIAFIYALAGFILPTLVLGGTVPTCSCVCYEQYSVDISIDVTYLNQEPSMRVNNVSWS